MKIWQIVKQEQEDKDVEARAAWARGSRLKTLNLVLTKSAHIGYSFLITYVVHWAPKAFFWGGAGRS